MPLENGTTISQLDSNWPSGNDSATRGDDHIRLVKSVLKAQFPGSTGMGFSKPITITEDELNGIVQAVSDVDAKLESFYPVGKVEIFLDDTNPNGLYPGNWTLVSGTASLSLGDGSSANVGSIVGSDDQLVVLPEHNHSMAHEHTRGSMEITGYFGGDDKIGKNPKGGAFYNGSSLGGGGADGGGNPSTIYFAASRSWSGKTSQPTNPNTGDKGTADATMNVAGARMPVNVWKRVS